MNLYTLWEAILPWNIAFTLWVPHHSKFSKNVHAKKNLPFFCRYHMEYLRDWVRFFSVYHLSPVNHPVVETNLQGDNYTRCNLQSISPLGWISKMASLYIYLSALKKKAIFTLLTKAILEKIVNFVTRKCIFWTHLGKNNNNERQYLLWNNPAICV